MDEAIAKRAVDYLTTEDFFREAHQLIYAAVCLLLEEGMAIDPLTVANELSRAGALEKVGGPAYLTGLTDGMPRSVNWPHYATITRELRRHRDIIHLANKLSDEGYDPNRDSRLVLDHGDQWLQELREGTSGEELVGPEKAVPEFLDALEERIARKHELIGLSSGLPSIDDITCGLSPGELIIVAADTGGGKSSLALQLGLAVAKMHGPTFYSSLEMHRRELQCRIAAMESGITLFKIRKGWLSAEEIATVTSVMAQVARWPLYIDDTTQVTVGQLRSKCRRLMAERALSLVVVDYVQLLSPDDRYESNRAAQVSAMSRSLKLLARELRVPVIALSQLSRGDKKVKRRPMLSDLKESSSLEQDADAVWFLYQADEQKDECELIIAKQRNGPAPSTASLRFEKPYVRLIDVEAEKRSTEPLRQADFPIV